MRPGYIVEKIMAGLGQVEVEEFQVERGEMKWERIWSRWYM
jgi:hypothetical protein